MVKWISYFRSFAHVQLRCSFAEDHRHASFSPSSRFISSPSNVGRGEKRGVGGFDCRFGGKPRANKRGKSSDFFIHFFAYLPFFPSKRMELLLN
ncbi:MAG: hypothetical protein ACTS6G_02990 [Candidatus Hodgkinia cicadicola]